MDAPYEFVDTDWMLHRWEEADLESFSKMAAVDAVDIEFHMFLFSAV